MLEPVWITSDTSKVLIMNVSKTESPSRISYGLCEMYQVDDYARIAQHQMVKVVEESFNYEDVIYNFETLW